MAGIRFGLALPHYGFSFPDGHASYARVADWARRAEELGFDSVWVSDHFYYSFARYGADPAPIASLEPLTTLAAIAPLTERVRLGTLVLCATFRHPSALAKMAASVDAISGGRLDLGVGAGWFEDEFGAFGYEFGTVDDRFRALERSLAVVDALREGRAASIDAQGQFLRDARLTPVPSGMSVFVGGKGGPRLLRAAVRYADGWNVVWRMSTETYAEKVADVRTACERADRDPSTFRLSVGLYGLIGEDERAARAAFDRGRTSMPGGALDAETYESWCRDTLSGSIDRVLERVAGFESLGVQELILSPWVLPFAVPEPEQVELFAARIPPAFRA